MKEHHVVVVVQTDKPYFEVMSTLVAAARDLFPGPAQARGYDPKKHEQELRDVTRERNAAISEAHRLRCRLEQIQLKMENEHG